MDITKLNVWLGVVANLSVIAGIVFLGFELRQTSDAVRANTVQSMSVEQAEFNRIFTNPDIANLVVNAQENGYDSLSSAEEIQLRGLNNSFFYVQQNLYYQYQNGNLDPEIWTSRHRAIVDLFRSDQINRYWKNRGFAFNDSFRDYIDDVVIPQATVESSE